MDFTIKTYKNLLEAVIAQGYSFQTFSGFLRSPEKKVIILRHDVDARKENSLRFAELEHAKGIQGSYYFRIVPKSFDEKIIKKISELGHEVGYHYETMDTVNEELRIRNEEFKEDQLIDAAYTRVLQKPGDVPEDCAESRRFACMEVQDRNSITGISGRNTIIKTWESSANLILILILMK